MNLCPLRIILLISLVSPAQAQLRIQQVTFDPSIGLGFPTQPEKMLGPTFYAAGSFNIETLKGWRLSPEIGMLNFRDAIDQKKIQYFFSKGYLRHEHSYYGFRLGKAFRLNNSGKRVVLSAGLNSILIV
ncbi:MAG: hypothetical protein LH606_06650 [Cytophagaceae bacterium]|nr:hypothetical protein [Cytophagaceae bacterium]